MTRPASRVRISLSAAAPRSEPVSEQNFDQERTGFGKPGVQVAVIARRQHGYFLTHVEGHGDLLNRVWFALMMSWAGGGQSPGKIGEEMRTSVELVLGRPVQKAIPRTGAMERVVQQPER